jgi:hypothetical protein
MNVSFKPMRHVATGLLTAGNHPAAGWSINGGKFAAGTATYNNVGSEMLVGLDSLSSQQHPMQMQC